MVLQCPFLSQSVTPEFGMLVRNLFTELEASQLVHASSSRVKGDEAPIAVEPKAVTTLPAAGGCISELSGITAVLVSLISWQLPIPNCPALRILFSVTQHVCNGIWYVTGHFQRASRESLDHWHLRLKEEQTESKENP